MFLVCGEALLDVFVAEDRPDGLMLDARPGGSPFNVAVGLARLDQPVELFTGLSEDYFGAWLSAFLDREGVGTSHAPRMPQPSSMAVVKLDALGVPHYTFNGNSVADRVISADSLPLLDEGVRAIHVGSIATAVEPVASSLLTLVRRESPDRLISYDPNVRPTVEPSLDVWRERLEALVPDVHVLKISREDLDTLYPTLSPEDAARRWIDQGVRLVVVTDGPNGAQAWTPERHVAVPGMTVAVVDTVGAGDTFQAGLLAALAERESLTPEAVGRLPDDALTEVLTFAARAAALTCSRRGADMPRRAEMTAG